MAFELPDHLPKGGFPRDRATQILHKVGQTPLKELKTDLVSSWIGELDNAIHETKNSIAFKIQENLHEFERLFQSSVEVQSRLREISGTVNSLEENLESPTAGIIPKLVETLTLYSARERSALESEVTYHTLEHLYRICIEIQKLHSRMDCGEIAEAAQVCHDLETFILNAPAPIQNANIMHDIRKRHRTLQHRNQELLSNAYDRCVSFSDEMNLEIHQWTAAPPVSTPISLSAVISSLSQDSLSSKLANLRRDILSKMVDSILLSPHSIKISEDDSSASFAVVLASEPTSTSPVQSLRGLAKFIQSHLTPSLSGSQSGFEESLYASMCSSLLTKFLQPSVPSSLSAIPAYLNILDDAINFENEQLSTQTTGTRYKEKHIKNWADDTAMHYEKRRRDAFLEKSRMLIASRNDGTTFKVEMIIEPTTMATLPSPSEEDDREDDQWGFGDEVDTNGVGHIDFKAVLSPTDVKPSQDEIEMEDSAMEEDPWGWKDDDDDALVTDDGSGTEDHEEIQVGKIETHEAEVVTEPVSSQNEEEEIDPWDDDPWAAPEDEPSVETKIKHPIPPPIKVPVLPAKTAKRLEKFTAKAKAKGQSHSGASTPTPSPAVLGVPDLSAVQPKTPVSRNGEAKSPLKPLSSQKQLPVKESYLVTVKARRILEIAGEVLREGKEMLQTSAFSIHRPQNDKLGQTLLGTTASIIDLYRALYPISQASNLTKDSTQIMQLSNDCLFLSKEMPNFKFPDSSFGNGKWLEAQDRTQTLGECCFEDAISKVQGDVGTLLAEADGFANVSEEHRYEKCKDVILRILDELQDTTQKWKKILSKSQYFIAIGRIVDDALYRLMDEIISLEDIPQKDSEYLSEFCEMVEKLEGSFVYAPGEQSVVGVYVPIWFKFSYLSWLIKGSIADISYMFEQGHLVDYEIDELVRLLRALFAKTPLRENIIAKIMQGHPNIEAS